MIIYSSILFKSYALGDCSTIEGNDLPATAQGNGSLEKSKKKKRLKTF
jgi:hypothetical protein